MRKGEWKSRDIGVLSGRAKQKLDITLQNAPIQGGLKEIPRKTSLWGVTVPRDNSLGRTVTPGNGRTRTLLERGWILLVTGTHSKLAGMFASVLACSLGKVEECSGPFLVDTRADHRRRPTEAGEVSN